MSVRASTRSPRICSGAMYLGLPMKRPVCVRSSRLRLGDVLHEPEVENLDEVGLVAVLDEEDVRGLEVAMDDAERVRLAQRAADLAGDVGGALLGEVAGLADGPVERVPHEVLHRHVVDVVVGATVVEDRDRVRVRELRGDARLEEEALVELRVLLARVVRVQHLERADAPERRLLRAIHLAHAAAGDQRADPEPVVDDAANQRVRDPGALGDCRRPVGHDEGLRAAGETQ